MGKIVVLFIIWLSVDSVLIRLLIEFFLMSNVKVLWSVLGCELCSE